MFLTKVVENSKTNILNSICVSFFKKNFIDEVMYKNRVELERKHIKIWCMPIACRITKTTNTHSKYVILNAFPLSKW
jgi:RNA recognition motif-containing protein